jgi:hypothetical protein
VPVCTACDGTLQAVALAALVPVLGAARAVTVVLSCGVLVLVLVGTLARATRTPAAVEAPVQPPTGTSPKQQRRGEDNFEIRPFFGDQRLLVVARCARLECVCVLRFASTRVCPFLDTRSITVNVADASPMLACYM